MSSVNFIATTQPSASVSNVKPTAQPTVAASQPQLSANSSSSVTKSSLTDQVALSSAGKALAASESNATQPRTPAQEKLIMAASSDSKSAEKIAYDMANGSSTIFYDIRGQRGVGDGNGAFVRKLSTTGQIVGDDYINNFNKEASVIDAQRRAIYDSEKAKRTDPLLILSKMIDFTNSQSKDYLDASGWGYQGSSPP